MPLATDFPADRIDLMMTDSDVALLLTTTPEITAINSTSTFQRLQSEGKIIFLDEPMQEVPEQQQQYPNGERNPEGIWHSY